MINNTMISVSQDYGLADPCIVNNDDSLQHPVDAIKEKMKKLNLTEQDMVKYIGNIEDVRAVLEKRMMITVKMILALEQGLEIPIDVLVQPYELEWINL